ncbi:AAA family ATPase [Arcobacter peruensis]|uniref:AAA family ATPase n=1 Tax=Arcobacter peruensis TaxID=2320140 RepID=UPI000F093C6F|nr:AAA family ATPase [Arcobacter peruensis]
MKFKSITINNLFSYQGQIKFDFNNSSQPISLIIGENGFGKTSFINSIKIALHGITKDLLQIGELTLSKQDYILGSTSKNFSGILNRIAKSEDKNKASVIIELEDGGLFRIKREFTFNNNSYNEKLTIQDFENESFIYDYEAQDFINYKISPTLAKFFFFDGEKIQTIADFSKDEFRQMLEDVLELDIYDQLVVDAENVIKKINKQELNPELQKIVTQKEEELVIISTKIEENEEKTALEKQKLKELLSAENELDKKLKKLEGKHKKPLKEAKEKLSNLEEEKQTYLSMFKELSYIQLPLLLNKKLKEKVIKDINTNYKGNIAISQNIIAIKKSEFLNQIDDSQKESMEKIFDNVFNSQNNKQNVPFADSIKIEAQYNELKDVNLTETIDKLISIKDDIKYYQDEIYSLDLQIQDDKKEYEEDFKKIKIIAQNIGVQNEKLSELEIQINELLISKKEIEREIAKTSIQDHQNSLAKLKIQSLKSTIVVAKQMKEKIKEDKREMLETSINIKFNLLKKEGYEADKIILDNDFNINVFDKDKRAMDILSSSSGQKQVIATALIWGISEYISEEIPMIIDTPLGRLDEKNQSLILNQFYPHASPQVLILPTPSELRHEGFKNLENDISQIFTLSNKGSATSITEQNKTEFFENRYK